MNAEKGRFGSKLSESVGTSDLKEGIFLVE
jgi:hypothetical protein